MIYVRDEITKKQLRFIKKKPDLIFLYWLSSTANEHVQLFLRVLALASKAKQLDFDFPAQTADKREQESCCNRC
jgi:hypothetical protein